MISAGDDGARHLASFVEAATPGPWTVHSIPGPGDCYEVRSGSNVVETNLSEPFARYFVFLQDASSLMARDATDAAGLGKSQRTTFSRDAKSVLASVRAEWVFVAPHDRGRYFLHNCVHMVGAGTLSRADARLIDAAKNALMQRLSDPKLHQGQKPRRALVIPRRTKPADVVAEYRSFADRELPLHALSGRNCVVERTKAMRDAIRARMSFGPGQRVLDIGCGDASLLRDLLPVIGSGTGTVLTEAERDRLRRDPGLEAFDFIAASFADLKDLPHAFDRIIANGCLHFARTRTAATMALRAIFKRAAPQAQVWIGELFAKDHRQRVFMSKIDALRHVRNTYGNAFALAFTRHMWRRRQRADVVVEVPPRDRWVATPEEFIDLATAIGFQVHGRWPCLALTGDSFYALEDRYSCLLSRP